MQQGRRRFNGALVAAALPMAWPAQSAGKAEPPALLLAQKAPANLDPRRYLVSEKYDGVRAFWDGNLMFSRQGQPIAVPAWFASHLPLRALDGELWMGRGRFDATSAAVRRAKPLDEEWRQIRYMLFELPGADGSFEQRAERLRAIAAEAAWADGLQAAPQGRVASPAALRQRLAALVKDGGEGLMLHLADAPYKSGRQPALLKLKPQDDEEAVVLAHLPGEGRYQGLLGALKVRNAEGREFLLGSGFSEAQRRAPPPVGSTVVYRYRGMSSKGLPRFATFLRSEGYP
ncbi:DNA ligase [Roseateles violae]|uniref:DNA ligase n=1 Tax=Roseateles violae TaxID=3058042 RepID=A0ABT8DUM6_9BURK|nr:DNA ligase [Pelomonas sp. PFR6]MDN3921818.1 DNA ligase [Pelomonas sp. PFR6]